MAHPKVIFAGKVYELPPLPIKHIRTVLPLTNALTGLTIASNGISKEAVDMLYDAGRDLLKIVDPSVTDEAYEDMVITPAEIAAALPVFIRQAGLERDAAPGEAPAEGDRGSTGMTS